MIARDGSAKSLWQDLVDTYVPHNGHKSNSVYDVIIVGGGITGISAALVLQEAGRQCLVLEANSLCFGTTGGTTAHLNTLLDTPYTTISKNFGNENARLVATAVKDGIKLVENNIDEYNIDCGFQWVDAFLLAKNHQQEQEMEKISEALAEVGVDAKYTPQITFPLTFEKALRIPEQAKFIPTRYVHAIARAFENIGGVIVQECRVTGADENGKISVDTSKGKFTGNFLVYATHIPPAVNLLHLRCIPYRSYVMAITLKNNAYPEELAYDMDDPYHYYRSQEIDEKKYLIGGGYDHKTGHDPNSQFNFSKLEAHMRHHFDVEHIIYQWSSQYFEPADGLPYIGLLPGSKGRILTATGFGGNGMVYSQVAAEVISNIILAEDSPLIDLFKPARIKPVAGFVNFIKHNADVIAQFAGKWFNHEDLENVAGLATSEAKVVNYNGQKLALYKDENNELHAVHPICTHLKCEVKWNGGEKSWDCPCHGARYSYDGKVLTGPADRDLEPVEIRALLKSENK